VNHQKQILHHKVRAAYERELCVEIFRSVAVQKRVDELSRSLMDGKTEALTLHGSRLPKQDDLYCKFNEILQDIEAVTTQSLWSSESHVTKCHVLVRLQAATAQRAAQDKKAAEDRGEKDDASGGGDEAPESEDEKEGKSEQKVQKKAPTGKKKKPVAASKPKKKTSKRMTQPLPPKQKAPKDPTAKEEQKKARDTAKVKRQAAEEKRKLDTAAERRKMKAEAAAAAEAKKKQKQEVAKARAEAKREEQNKEKEAKQAAAKKRADERKLQAQAQKEADVAKLNHQLTAHNRVEPDSAKQTEYLMKELKHLEDVKSAADAAVAEELRKEQETIAAAAAEELQRLEAEKERALRAAETEAKAELDAHVGEIDAKLASEQENDGESREPCPNGACKDFQPSSKDVLGEHELCVWCLQDSEAAEQGPSEEDLKEKKNVELVGRRLFCVDCETVCCVKCFLTWEKAGEYEVNLCPENEHEAATATVGLVCSPIWHSLACSCRCWCGHQLRKRAEDKAHGGRWFHNHDKLSDWLNSRSTPRKADVVFVNQLTSHCALRAPAESWGTAVQKAFSIVTDDGTVWRCCGRLTHGAACVGLVFVIGYHEGNDIPPDCGFWDDDEKWIYAWITVPCPMAEPHRSARALLPLLPGPVIAYCCASSNQQVPTACEQNYHS
jgi:hypothetical protein